MYLIGIPGYRITVILQDCFESYGTGGDRSIRRHQDWVEIGMITPNVYPLIRDLCYFVEDG